MSYESKGDMSCALLSMTHLFALEVSEIAVQLSKVMRHGVCLQFLPETICLS